MKAWLATQSRWLKVEQLPAYAHDLNPVELAWGNVKAKELANLCPDTIDEAHTAADAGLMRIGTNEQLCFNFLDHTGLSLSPPCSGSTETCLGRRAVGLGPLGPRRGPQVDGQGEDPVFELGLGVAQHGEVLVVELGLPDERSPGRALDRWQAPGAHRFGSLSEPSHHGLGVEGVGHGSTVPAGRRRSPRRPHAAGRAVD
jgi:hypothetical protein